MKEIIDMLSVNDFYGVSERVDIAKGKYEIPFTWTELWKNIKRRLWQTKKSK